MLQLGDCLTVLAGLKLRLYERKLNGELERRQLLGLDRKLQGALGQTAASRDVCGKEVHLRVDGLGLSKRRTKLLRPVQVPGYAESQEPGLEKLGPGVGRGVGLAGLAHL